jgi:hypothetical protein
MVVCVRLVVVTRGITDDVAMHDRFMVVRVDVLKRQQPSQGHRRSGGNGDSARRGA